MNEYDIRRLAIILALQAEIEAMKAENKIREMDGHSLSYNENHFREISVKFHNLAYSHNEQLF